jgi:hypothetical protein
MEKFGKAREATHDNVIQRMRLGCWATKTTDTHSAHAILIASPRQQWFRQLQMYIGLHVKYPSLFSDFNQILIFSTDFP